MRAVPELERVLDEAMLVAGELMTTAVLQWEGTEAALLTLLITPAGSIRIYVDGPGASSGVDAQITEQPPQLDGMGLRIVQALSSAWGAERGRDGCTLWAELTAPI
jgi:hypothetical protein